MFIPKVCDKIVSLLKKSNKNNSEKFTVDENILVIGSWKHEIIKFVYAMAEVI